jgi:tRNA (guanine37-N1)-methyltransferase
MTKMADPDSKAAAKAQAAPPYFATPADPSIILSPDDLPPETYFSKELPHPALIVPAQRTADLRKALKHVLMHRPKIKAVYPLDDSDAAAVGGDRSLFRKLVLAPEKPGFADEAVRTLLADGCRKSQFRLRLTYKDWTVDEVLRELLPVKEIPSAFEMVGRIAHINLRDDVLPFQRIVGRVILDKNAPRIETVVNKIGTIETEYRTFGMKVIAGNESEGWNIVTLREEGCAFELDFQNVYWNSRLAGEHKRLVTYIKSSPGTTVVVADAMAGVGPFAVPLTCRNQAKLTVYANDLNPTSFRYLEINAKKNKCKGLHCYNMDGRAFLHQLDESPDAAIDHVLMNLPASAPEFLDAFRGWTSRKLPEIHVHCFASKLDSADQEAIDRCQVALGCDIANAKVHVVRDVSPKKNMYCVSFVLPEAARLLERITIQPRETEVTEEPDAKKARVS